MSLSAKVKNVLSGDTVVLVPTKTTQFPIPERTLTLQYVRGDSYMAKEYLRQLVIGKEIKFRVLFKLPTTGKEFGDILAPIFSSLIEHLVLKGMVKLKDNIKADSEEEEDFIDNLRSLETKAQGEKVGVWETNFSEPDAIPLSQNIIARSQKLPLTAVVEKVISGDRVIGRIYVNANQHVLLPMILAGVKAPRTDEADANVKVAQSAKQYVEDRLLTGKQNVKVKIVGENQNGLPLVLVEHPSGNSIHEKLLENGFAEVVDWQSSLIGASVMGTLRKAEQTAKALGKGLFASVPKPASSGAAASSKTLRPGVTVENVTISKVINVDSVNVRLPSNEELTVQLASLRGPRPNDTTLTSNSQYQQALVQMAREFTRTHAAGKTATMSIDGYREANKDLGLEGRFVVSLKIAGKDLSELIVSNGFATVIKHNKQTSGERSMNWDKLIELEEEQKKLGKKGVYFTGDISKILTIGTRVVNASENITKARTFFNGFQKKGRVSGYYVEYVPSANRVRLYNPKEGIKLTLILGGLSNEKTNDEGLQYANKKFLQRNVEFEVYDTDKVGGFIGNLYATAQLLKPVQVELLENGFVTVHPIAVSSNKFASDFAEAENSAKSKRKGLWKSYDAEAAKQEAENATSQLYQLNLEAAKPKFFDIEIVDIDKSQILSFHLTDAATSAKFAQFKKEFNDFHAQNASASTTSVDLPINLSKPPKKNDMVSAKFDENNKYYRARVVNYDKASGKYEVKHIDFGNVDKVPLSSLRVLPKKFGADVVKPFAHTCKLQNIALPPNKPSDYLKEALYVLEDLTFDKKLVLSGLPSSTGGVEYDAILYDSQQSLTDPDYTINKQLVIEGYGIVETKCPEHLKDYVRGIASAQEKAQSERLGCWELGDIRDDEPF